MSVSKVNVLRDNRDSIETG